jgi:hypothetical protein
MDENGEKRSMPLALRIALALAALTLGWLLLSRGKDATPAVSEATLPPEQTEAAALPIPASTTEPPVQNEAPVQPAQEQAEAPKTKEGEPIVYDSRSYQLVTDMVYAYKKQVPDRDRVIAADVAALKQYDPRLGETWGAIMEYWDYANTRMELNYNSLPEDLPQDDSLCIVVLGFQLEPDGSMSPEMHGRCQLALRAAEQYPNAFIAVTGGGTAYLNPDATEAGVMAEWFLRKGIPEERLILEDQSSTTEENALFTRGILTEHYPQVKSLVIVSSDYHLPLGCLLFTEAALLYSCEYGELPYEVVSNLALSGHGIYEYKNPEEQALYVWRVADPQL